MIAAAVFASRFNQQYHDSFHIILTSSTIPLSLYSPLFLSLTYYFFTGIKLSSYFLSVGECPPQLCYWIFWCRSVAVATATVAVAMCVRLINGHAQIRVE